MATPETLQELGKPLKVRRNLSDVVRELNQSWDDRLDFPPTKLSERYLRHRLVLGLNLSYKIGGHDARIAAFIVPDAREQAERKLNFDIACNKYQLSVLIPNVHLVNDEKGGVNRITSFIRLKLSNEITDLGIRDALYFSFVSGKFVFIDRLILENREFNAAEVTPSIVLGGEIPHNVIETGSQMMDNFACEHAESKGNPALLMILNSLKAELVVILGNDGVIAFLKKPCDLGLKITDIFVGPF